VHLAAVRRSVDGIAAEHPDKLEPLAAIVSSFRAALGSRGR
jgi:hypothetical protein